MLEIGEDEREPRQWHKAKDHITDRAKTQIAYATVNTVRNRKWTST